jgi:hypothetical protein
MIKNLRLDGKYVISGSLTDNKFPKFMLNSVTHFRVKTSIYNFLTSIENSCVTDAASEGGPYIAISAVR